MKNVMPSVARMPEVVYYSLSVGEGLRAEPEWHQLQLIRIAEEARRAAIASGRRSPGAHLGEPVSQPADAPLSRHREAPDENVAGR
jgi:hypothetical protein